MTQIRLSCGFEAEIDEAAVNDFAFLEAIDAIQEGDVTGLVKLAKILLTPEEKKRFLECLKNENGRVPIDQATDQITELLNQLGSKKK